MFKNAAEEGGHHRPIELRPSALSHVVGTRFLVQFSVMLRGVQVYVTCRDLESAGESPRAVLIRTDKHGRTDQEGYSPYEPVEATTSSAEGFPLAKLGLSDSDYREAFAVWEWISTRRSGRVTAKSVTFGILLVAKPGEADVGETLVRGCLAPLIKVNNIVEMNGPAPRFVDMSIATTAFKVNW